MFITNDIELAAAVEHMRAAGTDLAEYELKTAAGGFPKTMPDSISAFANGAGGTIVFGISEKDGFHSVDIDVKMIQAHSAQAARELVEPPQMVDIMVLEFESKPVVVVNIPEASSREKPCYVKKLGQRLGSYIRTGDGDHKMSSYEIDRYIENQYRSARNDAVVVEGATIDDFDQDLLAGWLSRVRATTLGRPAALSDEELMANRRVVSPDALGTPVMVDLYPDRLELSNPGGLFGSLTVERLGQRGATASRNQFLARILEDVPYSDVDGRVGRVVENRGSGYPTINRELEQALMPAPIPKSTLDEFVLIMRHRRMTDQEDRSYTKENVKTAILGYITDRESVSTSELAKASGMSMKTVRRYLSALMEEGIVEGIGTANSPKRRYRLRR